VKNRKKNIILIQGAIFLVAVSLLYNTYRDKNEETEKLVEVAIDKDPLTNSFNEIEYSGFDLRGNRYVLNADKANFKTETPELINMKGVIANFYFEDNTKLTVISDEGIYNNITLNMKFKENVKATYLTNTLLSNQLDYSNSEGKLFVYGNVRGESIEKGKFFADKAEYNLTNKILDLSMLGSKQVNIKIKN